MVNAGGVRTARRTELVFGPSAAGSAGCSECFYRTCGLVVGSLHLPQSVRKSSERDISLTSSTHFKLKATGSDENRGHRGYGTVFEPR